MKLKFSSSKKNNFFKELVEESIERKTKIIGLRKNLIRQSNQLIEDTINEKHTLDKEELLKLSLPSFIKSSNQKEIKDIILISLYLVQMKKFMKLFGDDLTTIKDNGFFEQLKKIAANIIYEKFNKNRLVIRYGEEGNKFFLILKGEIQVVLPYRKTVYISIKEFKRYLLLLFIYKEFEILKLVIKENRVNQRVGFFNANYFFFHEDYNGNNINNNLNINDIKKSNNNINKNNFNKNIDNKSNKNNKINNKNIDNKNTKNSNIINNNENKNTKNISKSFNKNENNNINKNDDNNKILKDNINNNLNNTEEKNIINDIHKKSLNKLMNLYLTNEEISYYEKTNNNNIKEKDNNIKISLEDYINRLLNFSNFNVYNYTKKIEEYKNELSNINTKYYFNIKNDDEKSNFFIYEYKKLIELQTGDMFGDLALSSINSKRTASIITLDQCHFACLNRELYSEFIEKGNERIRNNKINYLCNINILKNFPKFILERKLFNHFAFINIQKDKYILKTNEINNNIIFLKDGVFEVSFTGNLNDLTDLINYYYYQYINLIKKKNNEENEDDFLDNIKIMNYQRSKIESLFQKDINDEFSYILFLVNAPSIFGFRPTERKNTKIIVNNKENSKEKINVYYSNFCVKCYSSKAEYIYIDKNMFYKHIYGMDSFVQAQTKIYTIEFFRKIIKRLLNIRYIKIWNLFLSNGVDKNININIDWDKLENNEDIYNAVDKLINILNEGQLYSNEMSKYIFDYFEKKKKIIQNQKQKMNFLNQNYKTEAIKNIITYKSKKNNLSSKFIDYSKINNQKIIFNNFNTNNKNNTNYINEINENNEDNIEDKYKKIVKKILNLSKENLFDKDYYYNNKHKSRNMNRASSASLVFKNNSLFVSKTGKNITTKNYLNFFKRDKSLASKLSLISTTISKKNSTSNNFNKIFHYEKKIQLQSFDTHNKYKKIKKFQMLLSRPSTTKFIKRNKFMESRIINKEKYAKNREKYVIKNTRILFTKTKNLDQIVRIKRNNSTL